MITFNSGPLLHFADLPTAVANHSRARHITGFVAAVAATAGGTTAKPAAIKPLAPTGILPLQEVERRAIREALQTYSRRPHHGCSAARNWPDHALPQAQRIFHLSIVDRYFFFKKKKKKKFFLRIALDATYSLGDALSGVGVYSRQISLRPRRPGQFFDAEPARWDWFYRSQRFFFSRSYRTKVPIDVTRRFLDQTAGAIVQPICSMDSTSASPSAASAIQVATSHDLFVLTGEYSTPEFRERFAKQARAAATRAGQDHRRLRLHGQPGEGSPGRSHCAHPHHSPSR